MTLATAWKHLAFNSAFWVTFWVFLGLQLSGAIHWSWWAVTAPLWFVGLGFAIYLALAINVALSVRDFTKPWRR